MQPLNQFVDKTTLTGGPGFPERAKQKLKLLVGRFVYASYLAYSHYAETQIRANSRVDRLSEAEVQKLVDFERESLSTRRKGKLTNRSVDQTFQGLIIPLVDAVIARDPTVKSAVDVSARYAFTTHEMAVQHPDITFTCISFAPNVAEYNAEFARPNLKFASGYALDLLEQGTVQSDIVMFGSTGPMILNRELRRYFRAAAEHAKYLVLNEPIYNRYDYTPIDPSKIPLEQSVPAYEHWNCFVHNYRAMVVEAGFNILHYDLFPMPAYLGRANKCHVLNLIAVNPHAK